LNPIDNNPAWSIRLSEPLGDFLGCLCTFSGAVW
jgi:hypothetical protein